MKRENNLQYQRNRWVPAMDHKKPAADDQQNE